VAVGLAAAAIGHRWSGALGRRPLLVATWAIVPPAALVVVSGWQPALVPRYALVCVPAVALAGAWILTLAPRRAGIALFAGLALAGLASSAVQQDQPYKYENLRSAADTMLDTARPGDGMVFAPVSTRVGIYPYLHPDAYDRPPADIALPDRVSLYDGSAIGGTEIPGARISTAMRHYDRIYLVGTDLADGRPGPARIQRPDQGGGLGRRVQPSPGSVASAVSRSPC